MHVYRHTLALYPGLLAPAFVTCSIYTGEGLVKFVTFGDVPRTGTISEAKCSFTYVYWVCATRPYTTDYSIIQQLSGQHQVVLATFPWSESCPTAMQKSTDQKCSCTSDSLNV